MRQDSMRSSVYRSFVTCDDPKGVIECGTIRKSKFCSKKLEEEEEETVAKVIRRGKKKNQKQEEDGEDDDDDDERLRRRRSSSLQLNEVARDALKLNRMADSYSNRSSFDGNSKDVAKDLLKGALDLQESLIMLGKLQESSTKMAKLKKKKKEEHNDQILGFQKQRLSVHNGYYSQDCFDELREAIKEGLAKQNLLLRRRNLDMASTSSTTHSSSSSSSMIENSQTRLPGNPNLIAKLMGLDHIPARTNSYKQQVKKSEDAQPPPIVIIKPARFLNPDCDTREMMKISDLYTKKMIKTDQKPAKRLNQDLGLKNMRRTRFKHQEDSFKPKASTGVPKKTKEERTQRRRNKPEENTKSVAAVSKSNGKTKKDRIVQIAPTPRFQNSQHKRRNPPQNNDKPVSPYKYLISDQWNDN
ncbi:uncharacterized protein LOC124932344 [Impatiens glandulifera]|uniref:uncharacterized protein LOC124932344 n=1 Tax=Impatiens glandulifera TaxID=253017 RepID=UPI001FB0E2CF|nr:uncharacterized protein LOC124932344 [Impatiens glandulifera]XP_047328920.1 uncharacterized protein LOC124932344 [Impatiens glandulifera]